VTLFGNSAITGWAHAQSHPKTKAMITASFQRQRAIYTETARGGPAGAMHPPSRPQLLVR